MSGEAWLSDREALVAGLARLGRLLVDEGSARRDVPAQMIRFVESRWPGVEELVELRRERDAALERGNRLAVRLAEIEASGGVLVPRSGVLVCARRGCGNELPPPRLGAGAPRKLCLVCGPRRRPLKRRDLAASWAEWLDRRNCRDESL